MLDANYRDLWENSLPRDMLYQLTIYAIGGPGKGVSVILYPVIGDHAKEQRIKIWDPAMNGEKGMIVLRPVDLVRLEDLVREKDGDVEKRGYAEYMVKGNRGVE